jgi:hypothetical protein
MVDRVNRESSGMYFSGHYVLMVIADLPPDCMAASSAIATCYTAGSSLDATTRSGNTGGNCRHAIGAAAMAGLRE